MEQSNTIERTDALYEIEKQRVIKAFFSDGVLIQSPAKFKKRNIAYRIILERFEKERIYTEKEVNEIISEIYGDYCEVRRHFIESGWMTRKDGKYWLID